MGVVLTLENIEREVAGLPPRADLPRVAVGAVRVDEVALANLCAQQVAKLFDVPEQRFREKVLGLPAEPEKPDPAAEEADRARFLLQEAQHVAHGHYRPCGTKAQREALTRIAHELARALGVEVPGPLYADFMAPTRGARGSLCGPDLGLADSIRALIRKTEFDEFEIFVHQRLLGDPVEVVASLGHELGHVQAYRRGLRGQEEETYARLIGDMTREVLRS